MTLVYPNIYPLNAAEYVASQLADVGLDVTVETVEFSVWLEQVFTNKDYDMTVVLHVEPRDIANYANPDYYWQYDSPEVQELIDDGQGVARSGGVRPSCSSRRPGRSRRTRRSTGSCSSPTSPCRRPT